MDVCAEVWAKEAAELLSVERFEDRLTGHASNPGWACVIGEIGNDVVGYANGQPDSEREWPKAVT